MYCIGTAMLGGYIHPEAAPPYKVVEHAACSVLKEYNLTYGKLRNY